MVLTNPPLTVRVNEAWEVGFNEIVDFAPFVSGTIDSVSAVPVWYWCSDADVGRFGGGFYLTFSKIVNISASLTLLCQDV